MKLADARDSKSRGVHSPCGFDSHLRHQFTRKSSRFPKAGRSVPWDRGPRRSLVPTTVGFPRGVGRSERLGDTPYEFTGAADERPAVVPAQEMGSRDLFRLASWAQHSGFSSHRQHRRVRGNVLASVRGAPFKIAHCREPMAERRSRRVRNYSADRDDGPFALPRSAGRHVRRHRCRCP